jgi:hypothetical protein
MAVPKKRDSGRNMHMYWPPALGERIKQLAARRGTTMTQIVVRVLAHAEANQLLEEWILEPPPERPKTHIDSSQEAAAE